jgi:hypothetical protein
MPDDQTKAQLLEDLRRGIEVLREHNPERECTLTSISLEDLLMLEEVWEYVAARMGRLVTSEELLRVNTAMDFLAAAGLIQITGDGTFELGWRQGQALH